MTKSAFYVYALYRDVERTVPFYIGKGRGIRVSQHEGKWFRNNDKNRHKVHCIEKCMRLFGFVPKAIISDNLTEEEAFALEVTLIAQWGRQDKGTGCLANATDGGEGPSGRVLSEASRRAIAAGNTGKVTSEETKELLRLAITGMKRSPETCAKHSAGQIGRVMSAETRKKIGDANRGRKRTDEQKIRMCEAKIMTPARIAALDAGREKRLENCKNKTERFDQKAYNKMYWQRCKAKKEKEKEKENGV